MPINPIYRIVIHETPSLFACVEIDPTFETEEYLVWKGQLYASANSYWYTKEGELLGEREYHTRESELARCDKHYERSSMPFFLDAKALSSLVYEPPEDPEKENA